MTAEELIENVPESSKKNPIHPVAKKIKKLQILLIKSIIKLIKRIICMLKLIKKIYDWKKDGAFDEKVEQQKVQEKEDKSKKSISTSKIQKIFYGKELDNSSFSNDKIQYSISNKDNMGRKLSKEQQEFFKDSKAVDTNRNLQTYYNVGGDYIVFDKKYMSDQSKWGKGIYLSKYEDVSSMYGDNVKEVYANYDMYDNDLDLLWDITNKGKWNNNK